MWRLLLKPMRLDLLSDEELMVKYQNGDEDAFKALFARLSPKVYGYLVAKVFNRELVNDIFQEVFVKLHKSKHLYNKEMLAMPWIFTITRTVMIDEVEKRKRHSNHADISNYEIPSEEMQSTSSERLEVLLPALERLPQNQKLALEMRYVSDKSFEEIASILNTNTSNVRQLVSRGLKRMKEIVSVGGKKDE